MTNFKKIYNGSWYTIEGADLKENTLEDWVEGYYRMLNEANIEGRPPIEDWVSFTGKEMNEFFKLTGNNKYPQKLTFLAFPLDCFTTEDVPKLAMLKLRLGDRWFDDIVENNTCREQAKDSDYVVDWEQ